MHGSIAYIKELMFKRKIIVYEEIHTDSHRIFLSSMMRRIHNQDWVDSERYNFVKRLNLKYTEEIIHPIINHNMKDYVQIKIRMTPEENTLYQLLPNIKIINT